MSRDIVEDDRRRFWDLDGQRPEIAGSTTGPQPQIITYDFHATEFVDSARTAGCYRDDRHDPPAQSLCAVPLQRHLREDPRAMKVVPRSEVGAAAWNACVAASREAWLFHDWAWVEIERTFFAASEHSFALEEGDAIVGVNPLYVAGPAQGMGDEHVLHCGMHRHATLALKDGLDPSTAKAARSAAMRHIIELARESDIDRIHFGLQTAAPAYHADERAEVPFFARDYGFQLGMSFAPTGISPCPGLTTLAADQVVMLDADEEVLFQRLDESCRRAVRRAQKAQLTWTIGSALEGLDTYERSPLARQHAPEKRCRQWLTIAPSARRSMRKAAFVSHSPDKATRRLPPCSCWLTRAQSTTWRAYRTHGVGNALQ